MTTITWKDKVRAAEPGIGTFLGMGSAVAAEVCALSGFDWLLVDLEHGAGGEDALLGQILAATIHRVPIVVRAESADRIRAGRVLDMGAAGVMFPRLDTPAQVAEAIAHLHYPPQGDRGVAGYNRARLFGGDGLTAEQVNDTIVGIVQIETLSALANVEEIAAIPGVDVLFVGPADLSTALGVPGQLDSAAFRAAVARVVAGGPRRGHRRRHPVPSRRAREHLPGGRFHLRRRRVRRHPARIRGQGGHRQGRSARLSPASDGRSASGMTRGRVHARTQQMSPSHGGCRQRSRRDGGFRPS